ncbi:hypothetical protein OM076_16000 [Solirubrobacter ginsenosidimutans]|uniref:DUF4142 domain-containing protein n=1 Tax=Solirubrobacter ginsenosidimutans TaxID=490573 RepID=A0A9X3S227_9ACTN|nr:hypothetical protein [Solirubrobacter ginsenosidimutans]MDA0161777.1 hypothetical protein [Solirubrobacter ginsenosidimutans]
MRLFRFGCVLAAAGLLAGCGSKAASSPSSTPTATTAASAATPTPTGTPSAKHLTSPDDLASCAVLEQAVQAVSQLVGHTTEGITQAQNPKELAKQVGTAQQSLLDSAKLVELADAPKALAGSQRQFAQALRMFATDFGRGKAAAAKGDMANATQLLTDETALRKIQTSAKRIDDMCGA